MTADPSILAGLLLYLALMVVVGLVTYRYMRTLDDFVLGGRRLGPWVSAISERASGESAWFLLGLPGAAYGFGFTQYWSVIGIAGGILASWTFIAIPLRRETARMGALTLPDYFELRFGDRTRLLRLLSMVAILFFYTAYVAAQLHGAGKILNATFGIPPVWGIVIGATVVVSYTLMGGFLAVAWTDLFQGILMTFVAVMLPLIGLIRLGGASALVEGVASRGPSFLTVSGGEVGEAFLFGVAFGGLSWGFGYFGQPHLLSRYMAIRRTAELRQGGLIAMGWTLLSYWGAPMIGIVGVAILGPDLADPEQVMPLLAKALVPGWLAGLMIAGATAAMMSTADSQLLVATSTLVEDIYVRLFRPGTAPSRLVLLSRLATVAIAGVAFSLALTALQGSALIDGMVSYAWAGLGSSFGPALLLSLWWRGTTRNGALAGMVTGIVATVVWQNTPDLQGLLDIKAASFLISTAFVVGVSLLTPADPDAGDRAIPPSTRP
ncbi:MAG: sodium/proline symporter [Acidobacteriota bacterium]